MFGIFFGWRKASKCKKLIKQVQCRLKLLKNKRYSIVRQLREDVAQLIKIGREDIALTRAEHLLKDESIVEIYDLLDDFCEFVIIHLSYIRKHKECPNDINEAISSLIYASARCGDLPELRLIRELFGERYGKRFEITALDLLPGNLVNHQVKEKLSVAPIPDDLKQKLVDKIGRDYCLRPEILALEYSPMQNQQVKEHFGEEVLDSCVETSVSRPGGSKVQNGNGNDADSQAIHVDLSSYLLQNPEITRTSMSPSVVQQSSPDIPDSPWCNIAEKREVFAGLDYHYGQKFIAPGNGENGKNGIGSSTNRECKQQNKTAASSSESLPQFPDEMIVYLDDIEEVRSSTTNQDQRVFKFKSSVLSKYNKVEDVKYLNEYESGNESSNSSGCRKKDHPARKRSRRRCVVRENANLKDIDCAIYYGTSCKRYSTHKNRLRFQSKGEQPSFARVAQTKSLSNCHFRHQAEDCYLNNPCYFRILDDRDKEKFLVWKHKSHNPEQNQAQKNIQHCHSSPTGVSCVEMDWYAAPQRPGRRSCELDTVLYDVFSCQDRLSFMEKNDEEKVNGYVYLDNHVASKDSSPTLTSPTTRKVNKPPYFRAMTMPQKRSENVLRSSSFPDQSPNHVHPKLPDYDDIAAKFMALKKERLQPRAFRA